MCKTRVNGPADCRHFYYIKFLSEEVHLCLTQKHLTLILLSFYLQILTKKKLDLNDILSNKKGLSIIVESILNFIMSAQRDDFLLSNHDSKNGFYPRSLNTSLFVLVILISLPPLILTHK